MNQYPPGGYIGDAMNGLPAPGPDIGPQTVEVNAGPLSGAATGSSSLPIGIRGGACCTCTGRWSRVSASMSASRCWAQASLISS